MRGELAVCIEGLALEISDADVSEVVVDEMRDLAAHERDVRGLDGARERRDDDEVERQRGELAREPLRLRDSLLREPAVELRVAVHDLVDVEERLPVPHDDEEPHHGRLSRGRPCGVASRTPTTEADRMLRRCFPLRRARNARRIASGH